MGAMDDVFGFMPARPDTEEFWRLSALVLELDGRMEAAKDKDKVWEDTVSAHVGLDEVVYLGMQRALRFFGITTRAQLLPRIAEVTRMSAFWTDAFIFGCEWGKEKYAPDA